MSIKQNSRLALTAVGTFIATTMGQHYFCKGLDYPLTLKEEASQRLRDEIIKRRFDENQLMLEELRKSAGDNQRELMDQMKQIRTEKVLKEKMEEAMLDVEKNKKSVTDYLASKDSSPFSEEGVEKINNLTEAAQKAFKT